MGNDANDRQHDKDVLTAILNGIFVALAALDKPCKIIRDRVRKYGDAVPEGGKKPSCGSVVIHLGTIVHDLLADVIKAMICMQPPPTSVLEVPKLTIALDPDLWKKVEDKAKDARRNIREVKHHLTVPRVLQRHLDITICIEISLGVLLSCSISRPKSSEVTFGKSSYPGLNPSRLYHLVKCDQVFIHQAFELPPRAHAEEEMWLRHGRTQID